MKLRCWPGALARVSERCSVVEWHGKIIACVKLMLPGDTPTPPPPPPGFALLIVHDNSGAPGPQIAPEWTFTGQRLFSFVAEYGRMLEAYSIEDSVLDPITPPPGAVNINTERSEDAEVYQRILEKA